MRILTAVAALALLTTVSAFADIQMTYGNVEVVNPGANGGPAWRITSDTNKPPAYGGLEVKITNPLDANHLIDLEAGYEMLSTTFHGGSPRFTIFDSGLNAAYLYWGTPQGGCSFTDPWIGSGFHSTGNLASLASADARVASNGFGGYGNGNTCETFSQFASHVGSTGISYVTLDLDAGSFSAMQQMDFADFKINGTTYNPAGTAPVPEPSSVILLLTTGGLALIVTRRRQLALRAAIPQAVTQAVSGGIGDGGAPPQ